VATVEESLLAEAAAKIQPPIAEDVPVMSDEDIAEMVAVEQAKIRAIAEARAEMVNEAQGLKLKEAQANPPEPQETLTMTPPDAAQYPAGAALVISQMQQQIETLRREVASVKVSAAADGGEVITGDSSFPWQYYKKPERANDPQSGWITCGPGGALSTGQRDIGSVMHYMGKGMKVISQYGTAPQPSQTYRTPGGQYIRMLENGGAREFPVSQILQLKWNIKPPIPGIVFPQLEAVRDRIKVFTCYECDPGLAFEVYCLDDDRLAPRIFLTHLMRLHEMRRDEALAAVREQGFTIGRAAAVEAERDAATPVTIESAPPATTEAAPPVTTEYQIKSNA